MNNNKHNRLKEVGLVLLVLVVASGVFLVVAGKTGLVQDGAAMVLQSWGEMFGGGSGQSVALDGSTDDSVDLSDGSSTSLTGSGAMGLDTATSPNSSVDGGSSAMNSGDSAGDSGAIQDQSAGAGMNYGSASVGEQNSENNNGESSMNSDNANGNNVAAIDNSSSSDDVDSGAPSADDSSSLSDATDDSGQAASSVAALQTIATSSCSFPTVLASSSRKSSDAIILNEIAWMGTLPEGGETAAKASEREWIELKNRSDYAVNISNWHILDSAGNVKIALADGTDIPPLGFYLLVRGGQSTIDLSADAGYTGSLPNAGDQLALLDADCGLSDFIDAGAAAGGWPGGNNATKQTLERDADGEGWHTSAQPGGTPRRENSVPAAPAPTSTLSQSSSANNAPAANISQFMDGYGDSGSNNAVMSSASSTSSTSTATSSSGSTSVQTQAQNLQSSSGVDHLVIAAVQIAGASSSNDFVKIYNPTASAIDISGWKLHKKSSTGTDYSLKTFPTGSTIAASGYFVWANSEGGFSEAIGADTSSTETLSADNSVALFDGTGAIVDQVAWGTGTNQYVETSAYPTDPIANQVLMRKTASGAIVDTDNNAQDFQIQ